MSHDYGRHRRTFTVLKDAVVLRGQIAWENIKITAAEQRELWRLVGEALLVGRRMNPSNQGFGKWLAEMGFEDIKARYRSAAMWLAENWAEAVRRTTPHTSDPIQIQKDFADNAPSILPADLQDLTAEIKPTVELDQRSAERVAKVINRAKSGDEGSEVAKRHVEALAKKHGTTPERLEEAAAVAAPAYFSTTIFSSHSLFTSRS
jgi:hypothetical protein